MQLLKEQKMGKAVTKVNKSEMAEFDPSMFEADAGTGGSPMGAAEAPRLH